MRWIARQQQRCVDDEGICVDRDLIIESKHLSGTSEGGLVANVNKTPKTASTQLVYTHMCIDGHCFGRTNKAGHKRNVHITMVTKQLMCMVKVHVSPILKLTSLAAGLDLQPHALPFPITMANGN